MDAEVLGAASQFGVAGLICWMWLCERRASGERERQITETHRVLMRQSEERDGLTEVVRDNTRAITALESGQRELIGAIERLDGRCQARRA